MLEISERKMGWNLFIIAIIDLWSLIRCSPNSSGIIGENSRAVILGKRRCNNCVQHELEKAFISQWDPPPRTHFQLFYFNDRLAFCEWKIKRINNADLFSQLPLLIFDHIYQGCQYYNMHINSAKSKCKIYNLHLALLLLTERLFIYAVFQGLNWKPLPFESVIEGIVHPKM